MTDGAHGSPHDIDPMIGSVKAHAQDLLGDTVALRRTLHEWPELGNDLPITRDRVLQIAHAAGLTVEERPFTLEEAKAAREVFITSTTMAVMPIVQIDDAVIANGKPGSTSLDLCRLYHEFCAAEAA